MHQPEYRDLATGSFQLPWTYLHAIKDYVDMAALLELTPGARAVVNFVPILLEQIDDYARQLESHLQHGTSLTDPLLAALAAPQLDNLDEAQRERLARACLRVNESRLINRFDEFRRLAQLVKLALDRDGMGGYLATPVITDLVVWYHLAWLGETVRMHDRRIQRLVEKGRMFDHEDRRVLLEVIAGLLDTLIGRYRRLSEQGKVELSMTPYAHPMLPLLLNFATAREAVTDMPLPVSTSYPGGQQRARWHIEHGLSVFERYFGQRPRGCWPSEGGVSDATVALLGEFGFEWLATGESILRNSLAQMALPQHTTVESRMHRPYRVDGLRPICFFRDDGLSDLIGFTYSSWHGDDAVNNMVHHLENIAKECIANGDHRVVSIILDGENAWESYPSNGYYFLSALYRRLANHPDLDLTTFADTLDVAAPAPAQLKRLVAGSWVYGTFSTWMGDADKNRGWDMLCEAKRVYDQALAAGTIDADRRQRLLHQLAACEGSDWFWWFGDYNPAETVGDFEKLFRLHLHNLYMLLQVAPPSELQSVISHGGGDPAQGGVMRPGQAGTH
ncbi:MAG: glycoside hydrolase [Gammaproteobacteria bacterium]|nr:glycoside hydrolase [Gammaproteobacteria bacterium]